MFLLLVIYCSNKASNRIVPKQKDLVFYSWITLSPEVSRLSPYTHTYNNIRELQEPSTYSLHAWWIYPFIGGESDVPWKEEKQILDRL